MQFFLCRALLMMRLGATYLSPLIHVPIAKYNCMKIWQIVDDKHRKDFRLAECLYVCIGLKPTCLNSNWQILISLHGGQFATFSSLPNFSALGQW